MPPHLGSEFGLVKVSSGIINKHSTESVLRAAVLKLSDLFDVYTEKMELEYSVLGDSTIREYIDHEE